MAGWRLGQAEVIDTGFMHDREWMLINDNDEFVSQRQFPTLALISPSLQDGVLTLKAPGQEPIRVPAVTSGPVIRTEVWTGECQVIDQGKLAADWLSGYLGRPCRLVRMQPDFKRPLKEKYRVSGAEVVGFADRLPFLLTSEASLDDLNSRLQTPVSMDRFRANIVIAGGAAFQEDAWHKIKVGPVVFRMVKPCDRCEIITVDQKTGKKGIEPLETLGTYRTQPKGIMFGQVIIHENRGVIRVGDPVEILE